jgi:glycosyltransferase involved in cell wall biosynthesis
VTDESVALVPAFRAADLVGATVRSLLATGRVARVLVVDDGSDDETATVAADAGAEVSRLDRNVGKGGALAHGLGSLAPSWDGVVLLVDADLGTTAGGVAALLDHAGPDRLVVGVPVDAAGRGGFGLVRDLAADGIERGCGVRPEAPLSGQRAVPVDLLRRLRLAPRFAVETAMTIDAVRLGAELVEVPVDVDHRHHGRTVAGFRHRAGQGVAVLRALTPRLGVVATLRVVLEGLVRRVRR